MKIIHRYNTTARKHYLLNQHYSFKLKPRLLYSGSLDKVEDWKENYHSHEFCEILFILDGKGVVLINNQKYFINRGDIVIYNAGVLHSELSNSFSPLEARFIAVNNIFVNDLAPNSLIPPEYDFIYPTGNSFGIFTELFNRIIDESVNKEEFYIEIVQNTARTILMYIFRLINSYNRQNKLLSQSDKLNQVISYIDEHYLEEMSLDTIALKCFVNKYYLSHMFKKYKNITVGQYIINKRLENAKRLLVTTQLSISKTAEQSGFNDFSYFCRAFKKQELLTPLQYRKKQQK